MLYIFILIRHLLFTYLLDSHIYLADDRCFGLGSGISRPVQNVHSVDDHISILNDLLFFWGDMHGLRSTWHTAIDQSVSHSDKLSTYIASLQQVVRGACNKHKNDLNIKQPTNGKGIRSYGALRCRNFSKIFSFAAHTSTPAPTGVTFGVEDWPIGAVSPDSEAPDVQK